MRNHPVFPVVKLRPYLIDPIPERHPVPPPPPVVEGPQGSEYEVESIDDSRMWRKKLKYLVRWQGYTREDRTWEPAEELMETAPEVVERFHKEHPAAPRYINALNWEAFVPANFEAYENMCTTEYDGRPWEMGKPSSLGTSDP